MKLASKITLLFLVPFVTLLLVLGYRSARREVAIYEAQVAADLTVTASALRPAFVEVLRIEGEARAVDLLNVTDRGLTETTIRWVRARPGEAPAESGAVVDLAGGGGGHATVTVPVVEPGLPSGHLEFTRPLDKEAELVRGVLRDEALTTLGSLLVAAAVAAIVGRVFIGRPVRSLVEQVRRIGEGDLASRLALARADELGVLADEVDKMSGRLDAAQREVRASAEAQVRVTEQLRHAAKLTTVGRLAAGLAHELGTPLNVVSGRARMIASGRLSPEAIVEGATIIDGQAARMTRIIRQLLDFARRGPPKKATVDPAELARHAVLLLAPLAKKRDVTLRLDLGEDADATAGKVVGDGAQLEQVIANLVVNAIDASKEGGEVVLSLAEEELTPPPAHGGARGRYLRLDVCDLGVGISPEDQDRVFEPFFTTKDVGAGTGLGLSVVHGIVHEHGGWVAVESQVGEGARFSVYLPRAPSE